MSPTIPPDTVLAIIDAQPDASAAATAAGTWQQWFKDQLKAQPTKVAAGPKKASVLSQLWRRVPQAPLPPLSADAQAAALAKVGAMTDETPLTVYPENLAALAPEMPAAPITLPEDRPLAIFIDPADPVDRTLILRKGQPVGMVSRLDVVVDVVCSPVLRVLFSWVLDPQHRGRFTQIGESAIATVVARITELRAAGIDAGYLDAPAVTEAPTQVLAMQRRMARVRRWLFNGRSEEGIRHGLFGYEDFTGMTPDALTALLVEAQRQEAADEPMPGTLKIDVTEGLAEKELTK